MAKKRKSHGLGNEKSGVASNNFDIEDRFNDSEDEFFAGQDQILLDDGPATKRRRRLEEQEENLYPSDEEVLQHAQASDSGSDEYQSAEELEQQDDGREEEEHNWGTSKSDYYNADVIETEADALEEEAEAKRLQQKQLKSMTVADFGFDETDWVQSETPKQNLGKVIEKLPDIRIPTAASRQDKVTILHSRYPEFEPLAKDFVALQSLWRELQSTSIPQKRRDRAAATSLRSLTSYLGAIAMYFALLSSFANISTDETEITSLPPEQLRNHPVIENLMTAKMNWEAVQDLGEITVNQEEPVQRNVGRPVREEPEKQKTEILKAKSRRIEQPVVYESELESDVELPEPTIPSKKIKPKRKLDLETLLAQTAAVKVNEDGEFGDEEPLTEQQAAEKASKKKSLRFYTSQIAQKANKRGAASRGAGGDDDVPHKERLRDKQERSLKDAEKRGQQQATAEEQLGNGYSDDDDVAMDGDEQNYYQSLVADSERKKADKQARADAYAEAARQGGQVYEEEQVGPDGKRRITYAIEKNKGLTPKRNKDVRNPRVKKRKKYDEKMKKLGSIRQVYKGGEGRGGYGGELTGIKTNVVKSVKL